jgi:ubiquinone/menaquinone biosynthesis C-methylase UbiE
MEDKRESVQQRFGTYAQNYVSSTVHASGYSLERLLEVVQPSAGMRALDIATGGGHVALGLAKRGVNVIAGDLTVPMLDAARKYIRDDQGQAAEYAQMDAQHLPFADNTLDLVTCRIAPHHFSDVARFVRECARVVKPGGIVGIVDQIAPGDPEAAKYINAYEMLRDPSHVWEYGKDDWESFFSGAGLTIRHTELARNRLNFDWWTKMQNNDANTVTRLRVMLKQAPADVAAWLEPDTDGEWSFSLWQLILVGVKGE